MGEPLCVQLGSVLGTSLGASLGDALGTVLGAVLGTKRRVALGMELGPELGEALRPVLGDEVGEKLGLSLGKALGATLGPPLGPVVGSMLGSALGILLLEMHLETRWENHSVLPHNGRWDKVAGRKKPLGQRTRVDAGSSCWSKETMWTARGNSSLYYQTISRYLNRMYMQYEKYASALADSMRIFLLYLSAFVVKCRKIDEIPRVPADSSIQDSQFSFLFCFCSHIDRGFLLSDLSRILYSVVRIVEFVRYRLAVLLLL
jgi:hypothetical protein